MAVGTNVKVLIPQNPFRAAVLVSVVGLGADPNTVVVTDSSSTWIVSCLESYRRRAPGDQVLVAQLDGGAWLVLGKIGADQTPVADVTYGVGGPPSGRGMRKVSQVWQGTNPDGTVSLYSDMTSAAPAPVKLPSTDAATWAGSSGTRAAVVSSDTQLAAWYYGSSVADVCAGKQVTSMKVTLTRLADAGPDMSVPVRLGLHALTSFGQPSVTDMWDPQVQLAPGQTVTVPVPDVQVGLLAGGSAKGLVSTGATAYVEYATTAPFLITFG